MKIGVLKTDTVRLELVETFGEYPQMFHDLLATADDSIETVTYDVMNGQYPKHLDEVDGYLITGSKLSVYDDVLWIKQLGEFVNRLHDAKKKIIGICFGHQLVAHFLGGRAEKSHKGWGIGVRTVTVNKQAGKYSNDVKQFDLLYSHQDQVTDPAIGASVLAGNEFCPIAMTQVGNHILTFQGHPEFSHNYARGLMELRRDFFGEALYKEGLESLRGQTDSAKVARWIVEFIADVS